MGYSYISFWVCEVGVIIASINDQLELEFRRLILEVKGKRRGAISEAVEEAIRLWVEEKRTELRR